MSAPGMPRGPWRLIPFLVALVAIGGAAIFLPNRPDRGSPETLPSLPPPALSDTPAFGWDLPDALAYLGDDRVFNLINLSNGAVIGSRGVPADRVPAAASDTRAYLGRLPAATTDTNWDGYRSIPWRSTEFTDHPRGNAVAYSRELDTLAITKRPIDGIENGVEISGPNGAWIGARSSGSLDVSDLGRDGASDPRAERRRHNVVDARRAPSRRPAPGLATRHLPTHRRHIGSRHGRPRRRRCDHRHRTSEVFRLPSGFSWAAQWQPGRARPLLATVRKDPPAIVAYNPDGTLQWSAPLRTPVTTFKGGVSWSPDGTYVIVAARNTFEAYNRLGGYLGRLDRSLPTPKSGDDVAFVVVVPLSDGG